MADIFSQNEIDTLIQSYAKTSAGKKAIGDYKIGGIDVQGMKIKARDMANILYNHIISDTKSAHGDGLISFPASAILIGEPEQVAETGQYTIKISFDSDALRRASLDPTRFPKGIQDIIQLFVTGYKARGSVHGTWHDKDTVSLRHRESNDFMTQAVNEFNSKYQGSASAVLDEQYIR